MKLVPQSKWLRGSVIGIVFLGFAAIISNQLFAQAQDSARLPEEVGPVLTLGDVEYIEVNTDSQASSAKQLIVFVHGTPGSFTAFLTYMTDPLMQENFHMIAVTRPGWVERNADKLPSLNDQAAAIEPFLHMDRSGKGAILMGHSYGGPVIAKTAMEYTDLVAGLVFVASTGDPELSGPRWYNRFAVVIPRFILGDGLKGANAEIMPLRPQLEEMLPSWEALEMPVLIVQGDRDRLVNPRNAEFMQRMLVNADVTYLWREGLGHFVLWEEAGLIVDTIIEKYSAAD